LLSTDNIDQAFRDNNHFADLLALHVGLYYGKKYVGEFKDGKEHGKGTYTYPDGVKYEGEWKDGKEHGHGTLTTPDGFTDVPVWKDESIWIST